jgi:hypothetical protein
MSSDDFFRADHAALRRTDRVRANAAVVGLNGREDLNKNQPSPSRSARIVSAAAWT